MKKIMAMLLAAILLIGTCVWGVSAEGFEFKELGRRIDGETLIITWNYSEVPANSEVEIEDVMVGSVSCVILNNENGELTVDISELTAGVYPSVMYEYMLDDQPKLETELEPVIIAGEAKVTLTLSFDDAGLLIVKATDESGNPVAGYDLIANIGDMVLQEGTTGTDGTYKFRMITDFGDSASCSGMSTDSGKGVMYAAAAEVSATRIRPTTTAAPTTTTVAGDATTTEAGETTTTIVDGASTTKSSATKKTSTTTTQNSVTHATIRGAGTTSKQDDKIAVNVSLDTNILNLFGLKQADFDNNARMLLSEEDYSALVGRTSNLLMLNVLTAQTVPSNDQIQAALTGTYATTERKSLTFDLSFLIVNKTTGTEIPVSAIPLDTTYLVQLPVPKNMMDCQSFAVTVFNGDSLMTPVPVEVKNGCFQLQINSLEPYTLIGFGEGGNNSGSNSVLLIILLIVGVLLIIGAAVLGYLFLLRKPVGATKRKVNEEDSDPFIVMPESFGEDDIFSGRPDISEINRRPSGDKE